VYHNFFHTANEKPPIGAGTERATAMKQLKRFVLTFLDHIASIVSSHFSLDFCE